VKRDMEKGSRIFVAGHRGLAGSAIRRSLERHDYTNLLFRTRHELDLADRDSVRRFFEQERPEYVVLAAAKVGGIAANDTCPADFIHDNLEIQTNVIDASYRAGVKRLLFLGSSCIYPKLAPQPLREDYLLSGPLESTNRAYAVAKIAGIEMCRSYNQQHKTRCLAVMPTNLYGLNDNFDLESSHVLPALIHKAVCAVRRGDDKLVVWGSGTPRREFLHSDDFAEACVHLLNLPDEVFDHLLAREVGPLINVGTGQDVTIRELAELVCQTAGFRGRLEFDPSRPDGTPRKLLDVSLVQSLGWVPKISLTEGIRRVYEAVKEKLA
jgi:GDP-L-fucose synthase